MLARSRALLTAVLSRARRGLELVKSFIGPDEFALVGGLIFIGVGLWNLWRPGVFIVPGAVLVWIALPERKPFIERRPLPPAKRRV